MQFQYQFSFQILGPSSPAIGRVNCGRLVARSLPQFVPHPVCVQIMNHAATNQTPWNNLHYCSAIKQLCSTCLFLLKWMVHVHAAWSYLHTLDILILSKHSVSFKLFKLQYHLNFKYLRQKLVRNSWNWTTKDKELQQQLVMVRHEWTEQSRTASRENGADFKLK